MRPAILLYLVLPVFSQILTDHANVQRTGAVTTETMLTPGTASRLLLNRSYSVDDAVWTQPLYVPGVVTSGVSHNLLIVATMNDTIYAFDTASSTTVWSTNLETPWTNLGAVFLFNTAGHPNTGCLSTPAIDQTNNLLYAVCAGGGVIPHWKLWKLNLQTGAVVTSTTVAPSVTGTGDGLGGTPDNVTAGVLTLFPAFTLCRPGLLLGNSEIYVTCGSTGDFHPWHGWLVGYNTSDLSQANVFCTTANSWGAAFWGGGRGPVMDSHGNLYVATGNGDYDGSSLWGQSVIKLSSALAVLDWYTPTNWSTLNSSDFDLVPGGMFLISDRYLAWESKQFLVYTLDTTCMGHLGGTVGGCSAPQSFATPFSPPANTNSGSYSSVFLNNVGYFSNTVIKQDDTTATAIGGYSFTWTGTSWNTTVKNSTPNSYQYQGPILSASSNGSLGSVLWAVTVDSGEWSSPQTGTLRAWNTDFTELAHVTVGNVPKFAAPTVAAGQIFVATVDGNVKSFSGTSNGMSGSSTLSGSATMQ